MNLVFHALAGGAIAHVFSIACVKREEDTPAPPSAFVLGGAALTSLASHGLLDWLKHGYPVPSRLDALFALISCGLWLAFVHPRLRSLFALAFFASFFPDLVDHLPRILNRALHADFHALAHAPLFPWHTPRWSGSLYPRARIPLNSSLVAIEAGNNRLASIINHVLVGFTAACCIFWGRAVFTAKFTWTDSGP